MHQTSDRAFILFFRLAMAWTFLYAASHQVFVPGWSVAGFLNNTKTFHDLFAPFASPSVAPIVSFLVGYGHLLIGLSLLFGALVRISAVFGILLLLMYWMAHMDWPYIENHNNFIIDYHIIYSAVLAYLIAKKAGHVMGLDGWIQQMSFFGDHPRLRVLVS